MILANNTKFNHKVLSIKYYFFDLTFYLYLFFNNQHNFFDIYETLLLPKELEKDQN